jgi:phosphate transport system substrate-binding protein
MLFNHRFITTVAAGALLSAALLPHGQDAQAQSRNQIRIVGSSTVFPFSTAVAENFGRSTEYPAPIVESTGSGGGLQLFCQGVGVQYPDITNASRRMEPGEYELCEKNGVDKITEVQIGNDGIVLANARDATSIDVSREELWQALAKKVPVDGELQDNPYTNWSDIDSSLPDQEIKVYGPPPTSGTRDAFVELVMEKGCENFEAVQKLDEEEKKQVCGQIREDGRFIEVGENDNLVVQRLQNEPNALGIFGFSFLSQNRDKVKGNAIEGVEPTFESIASGDYPVSRSLYFYVKNDHVGVIPGMKEYIKEFTSPRTWGPNGYLAGKGLIPLQEQKRQEMAQQARNLEQLEMASL